MFIILKMLVQAFVNVKGSKKMNKKMNWWQKNIKIKKKNHQYWLWSVFPLGIIEGIKG